MDIILKIYIAIIAVCITVAAIAMIDDSIKKAKKNLPLSARKILHAIIDGFNAGMIAFWSWVMFYWVMKERIY